MKHLLVLALLVFVAPITIGEEDAVSHFASGSFEVKLSPQPLHDALEGTKLGRMSIDKTFEGDLEGTSKGEMLMAMTEVEGSAGYSAIEVVTGSLEGRAGSFVLHHKGTMNRGAAEAAITVVPDSGTGELEGIAGSMQIEIKDGGHFYTFEYRFD
ncbi:MAG: DUF3224 domain-containing protein [Acidobacteriota bacterium]